MARQRKVKRTPVRVSIIKEDCDAHKKLYRALRKIIEDHHPDLKRARIVLAYREGWRPNADGQVTLAKVQRPNEAMRKLSGADAIILLNRQALARNDFSPAMRDALLDHECCHLSESLDSQGEPKLDADGNPLFRVRRGHDMEEFVAVVQRHGKWTAALARFAETLSKAKDLTTPLLNAAGQ
jgi:hypothetical protein